MTFLNQTNWTRQPYLSNAIRFSSLCAGYKTMLQRGQKKNYAPEKVKSDIQEGKTYRLRQINATN